MRHTCLAVAYVLQPDRGIQMLDASTHRM